MFWIILILFIIGAFLTILSSFVKKESKISRVVGIILIIIALIIAIIDRSIQRQAERKAALSGLIEPKSNKASDANEIIVFFGTNFAKLRGTAFTDGRPINPLLPVVGMNYPLVVRLTKEGLLISVEVRSLDKRIVAKLRENEWVINHNNYFQRNYDKSAIEVIDQDGIPVLQVELINPNSLRLGGVFVSDSNIYIVTDKGYRLIPLSGEQDSLYTVLQNEPIPKCWFVYPSDKHLGERVQQ